MEDEHKARWRRLLRARKYEFLLFALVQHLFIAVLLPDMDFYARYIWPLNMLLLGYFSVGVFADRSRARRIFKAVLNWVVLIFPILGWFVTPTRELMATLSVCYLVFFLTILSEVMRYLLRPSYINVDLVSAAICGYLLLLETGIFLMQTLYYTLPEAFRGISTESYTAVYLDIVYFCSIVATSIGFGDITPSHHMTKLATSMLGVTGQMYAVVLVGILVSKYSSASGAPQ